MLSLWSQNLSPGDDQARFIQDRISNAEKHLGDVCCSLGLYTKNAARYRDNTDELVQSIIQFADAENISSTLPEALGKFAACYSSIADHRDAFVRRLDTHVVGTLTPVGTQCKDAREQVKAAFVARNKETERHKQLDKMKQRNARNRQKILLAETELARASADVSRNLRSLEEQMDAFELDKIQCTANALRNLVQAEIALHARELELLTQAYAELSFVDEQHDLEAFRSAIRRPPASASKIEEVQKTIRSLTGFFSNSASSLAKTKSSNFPADRNLSPVQTSSTQRNTMSMEDGLDTLSIESSSNSSTNCYESRMQRSVSQPKLIGSNFK